MTSHKKNKGHIFLYIYIISLIFLCIYPMKLSPIWNGEIPGHRNQYEKMAVSLLHGHLWIEDDVSQELLGLENPYDPNARKKIDPQYYNWDYALYDGHYYMYFGIAPVALLFLPYRIITGKSLTTYHATQLFTTLIIIGFFKFFFFLRNRFFYKMPDFILIAIGTAGSLISVWYFVDAPALYCTAISSAVCFMLWSFYFYFKAVYITDISLNKRIFFSVIGAIFGALSLGCRPPVALMNILLIPLFINFIKNNNIKWRNTDKIIPIFIPYIIIGICLMLYNYARFDDLFEFGQKYQITRADQTQYKFLVNMSFSKIIAAIHQGLFEYNGIQDQFPWVTFGGAFAEYPVFYLVLSLFISNPLLRKSFRNEYLYSFELLVLLLLPIYPVITKSMADLVLERYHSDYLFLLCIFMFIVIGHIYNFERIKIHKINTIILCGSIFCSLKCILFFFVPHDSNFTAYYPNILDDIRKIFSFL